MLCDLISELEDGHKGKYLSGKNRNNCESVGFGKGDREQQDVCCTWSRV